MASVTTPADLPGQLHHRQLATLLRQCGESKSLSRGKLLHRQLSATLDVRYYPHLSNLLILMYGKCSSLPDAWAVFHSLRYKNVFTWNIMLSALCSNDHSSQALKLFHSLLAAEPVVSPTHVTYIVALTACSKCRDLGSGVCIHEHVAASPYLADPDVCCALITMYGKCGSLVRARDVFDAMPRKGIVAWSAMLAACARNPDQGGLLEAMQVYRKLRDAGVAPDEYVFISVLEAVAKLENLEEGKMIHGHVRDIGLESHPDVAAAVINMYGKVHRVDLAMETFQKTEDKTVAVWNTAVSANTCNGHYREAIEMLWRMDWEGFKPEMVTLIEVLAACAWCEDIAQGSKIHERIRRSGWEDNVVAGTSIVNMYGKCGQIKKAKMMFDRIPRRDVVTWNAMISAFVQCGLYQAAINLYKTMDVEKNSSTYMTVISACASGEALEEGKAIHAEIISKFATFSHPNLERGVGNALINMYGRCCQVFDAKSVFDLMREKNTITWNAMIAAYAYNSCHMLEPLELYYKMLKQDPCIKPDKVTFVNIFHACSSIFDGRALYSEVSTSEWSIDTVVINSAMAMFVRCGSPGEAMTIFQSFKHRSSVSWTIAIAARAQQGSSTEAVELFLTMVQQGLAPDRYAFVGILTACSHAGLLDTGWNCFTSMRWDYGVEAGAEHYGCMVDLLSRAGRWIQAQELVVAMPFSPDEKAWTASLVRK